MPVLSNQIKTKLLDLNNDGLISIFNNCTLHGLINLSKTCRRFRDIISQLPRYKKGVKQLKEIYDTRILKWKDENFILEIFEKKYSDFVLNAIDFRFHSINELWLSTVSRRIKINKEKVTNTLLSFISRWCKNLTCLSLIETDITDITSLGNLKMLETLDLYGCTGLTDLSGLGNFEILKTLDLRGCTGLMDVSLIDKCKNLEFLTLNNCTGLRDLPCLSNCKKLCSISLKNCTRLIDVSGLSGCTGLNNVNLYNCISLMDVSCFSQHPRLMRLKIEGCLGLTKENIKTLWSNLDVCVEGRNRCNPISPEDL